MFRLWYDFSIGICSMIFRLLWYINLGMRLDYYVFEEDVYGIGLGDYSECLNDYNVIMYC